MTRSQLLTQETEQLPADTLTESQRYRLLASETRRHALAVLETVEGSVELDELATRMRERDVGSALAHDRLVLTLHHVHLPTLDDADVVDYDPEGQTVDPRALSEV